MNHLGPWYETVAPENKYQYNGKELSNELNANLYEYGARWYDPAIGRFVGVDPIADKYAWVSPYNYAENEPTGAIDLWGLQKYEGPITDSYKNRKLIYSDKKAYYKGTDLAFMTWTGLVAITYGGGSAYGWVMANPATATVLIREGGAAVYSALTEQEVPGTISDNFTIGAKNGIGSLLELGGSDIAKLVDDGRISQVFKQVNFDNLDGIFKQRGFYNCEGCSLATDAFLKGRGASALGDEFANISGVNSRLKQMFGSSTVYTSFDQITDNLTPGSTGIVTISHGNGHNGHAFNIANIEGKVRVFDGQLGVEINSEILGRYLRKVNPNGFSWNFFNTTGK